MKCPTCGSHRVEYVGHDEGSGEHVYECQECGQRADRSDF